ncbi:DEAD/DEAH box helicase family protein [Candidatus Palauibacter sp.]|uniref:DEAD/DEAH box helicase family protein n=1 Tax=Candidatus Palauibacter sp. TaxID=3101350 RepID=UPI003B526262
MTPETSSWIGLDGELARYIAADSKKTLEAYRSQPKLVQEHANQEKDTARGGYAHRQLFELVQNGADALASAAGGGRIVIQLTESHLYCADDGRPIDQDGVTALKFSHMSPKRGTAEIGRFGLGFKSVLGVSSAPEFFSRLGSFRFDPELARRRISEVAPVATSFPTLRLPEPLDPHVACRNDQVLNQLMKWANNIVRLPLKPDVRQDLVLQMEGFPGEFLLFVEHVRSLWLFDWERPKSRRFATERRGDEYALLQGDSASEWKVFDREHTLSYRAREDSRSLDNARSCLIRWAVPLTKSPDTGYFWAFFPTRTASLVSGILNAPWKTNEDRQNLLPGPYNEELIEAAAGLIADSLPHLSSEDDSARHLDALPRKEAPGDSEQSKLLRKLLFATLSDRDVVPNQDGVLRKLREIRYPPRELTSGGRDWDRTPFEQWAQHRGRPCDWLHTQAITSQRLAKIDRLFETQAQSRWRPRMAPRATIADWLEALVKGRQGSDLARASMAAVRTAALIPRSMRPQRPEAYGRIVLGQDGKMHLPDPEEIFLPSVGTEEMGPRAREVHEALASDIDTRAALENLGIVGASAISEFDGCATFALESDPAGKEYLWPRFWELSRRVSLADAVGAINHRRREHAPYVLTLAETWAPVHSVLLPGVIVGTSDDTDAGVTVDTEYHAPDLTLLESLGVRAEPQADQDVSADPWFREYNVDRRIRFRDRKIPNVRTKPQENRVHFDCTSGIGPLNVLRRLSPSGAARFTNALLSLDSTYESWTMRHETQTKYPPLRFASPAVAILRRYGWVETAGGPVLLKEALGSRPWSKAALHVLLAHPEADKIKTVFSLTEPPPVVSGPSDPVPLLDAWPGLKECLREDQAELVLRRCDHIAVAGQERKCVLHSGAVYLTAEVEDEAEQLRFVAERLALRIDPGQLESILERRSADDIEERRAAVRMAKTDAQRLLKAVGETNLRVGLGESALAILEREKGRLDEIVVAEAVIATHHTDALRQFRWALDDLDPPRQWAGSAAAVRFVQSLGFSIEWAGQRDRRRESCVRVPGPFRLPPLHGYQETIVSNVRSLLHGAADGAKRRGMISLPTGSGKTRVAVQALVEQMRDGELDSGILWVADRDELCEQAVESWMQVWSRIGAPKALHISRFWGGQRTPERIPGPHVVVATIQTLRARFSRQQPADDVLRDIGIIVFDEAHRSIAPTFTSVMQELGLTRWQRSHEPFLIGLTATPYRGYNADETEWLARRYASNRLDHGAFARGDPEYIVKELQDGQVLAEVDHETIEGGDFSLSSDEISAMRAAPWLPRSAEDRLARDADRTTRILDGYRRYILPEWPTLIFATSVEHAGMLSALLSTGGIRARAVSGQTEVSTRRRVVEEFRNGDIQALVNYAVFREGFDAPKTRAIVVARPVYSPNLYFQMIGRGMRGPKNGGNDRCLVLNVRDNIRNFDRALAFSELDWLWARDHAVAAS